MSSNFSLETFSLVSFSISPFFFELLFIVPQIATNASSCVRDMRCCCSSNQFQFHRSRDEWRTRLNNKIFVFLSRQREKAKKREAQNWKFSVFRNVLSIEWLISLFEFDAVKHYSRAKAWQWNENLMHNTQILCVVHWGLISWKICAAPLEIKIKVPALRTRCISSRQITNARWME